MSYRGIGEYYEQQGMGSYYEFSPHQVYAGYGNAGYGSYYELPYGASAAAVDFDPDRIMANIAKSDICYGPGGACAGDKPAACKAAQGACNYAGQQANKEIAVGLNALGYGPIAVDGSISWKGAYAKFLADHGLTKGPGFGITKQAMLTMKSKLDAGETPGPKPPVEFEKVNGEFIPKNGNGDDKVAGMGAGTLLLAAAVIGGIGYLAYRSGKKKKGGRSSTAMARR